MKFDQIFEKSPKVEKSLEKINFIRKNRFSFLQLWVPS